MTAKDVKSSALHHSIPLYLHPVALTNGWTMEKLPDDMIGLYEQYFEFTGIRLPFSALLLAVIKHFRLVSKGIGFLLKRESAKVPGAIPDAMAWRHHDSDINDPASKDGFMVTMSEYLRFPFLSGASILKGPALTPQDQIGQHTTRPLPGDQTIPEKTDHQKRVEVEDPKIVVIRERKARAAAKKKENRRHGDDGGEGSRPKTKRKKTIAHKDGFAAYEATSSPAPLQTIILTDPTGANPSADGHDDNEETNSLRLGSLVDQSRGNLNIVHTEVLQSSSSNHSAHPSPTAERRTSLVRSPLQGTHAEEGESSWGRALYVPDWSIHQRCCLDTPMWCRELMVHLAPPVTQEESNALNNATALERAWFSLARGALAQTDILERFEHLQAEFDRLAETHADCGDTIQQLIDAREASQQSLRLYLEMAERFKKVKNDHASCTKK
ncbi:hypothetical protein Tco_0079422, partial [Tanacetum coccineum]